MYWPIGITILYLGIGLFILLVFIKNRLSGYTVWNVLAVLFGWFPIGLFPLVKTKIENFR